MAAAARHPRPGPWNNPDPLNIFEDLLNNTFSSISLKLWYKLQTNPQHLEKIRCVHYFNNVHIKDQELPDH